MSDAAFTGTTGNALNYWAADMLRPPTGLAATQLCVADPTPVFRSAATASSTTGSITISRPPSIAVGDLLVAQVLVNGGGGVTPPAGWTAIRSDTDPGALTQALFRRLVSASEPASYTFSSLSGNASGGIGAWSGADPTQPVDAHSGAVTPKDPNKGEAIAPSVTTRSGNDRLVGFFGSPTQTTYTPPAGMTQRWDVSSAGGSVTTNATSASADESFPGIGATGSRTATPSSSAQSIGALIALRPPNRPAAALTWTATTSTYASGYQLSRSTSGTLQSQSSISGRSTTSTTNGPLTNGTSYTFTLTAIAGTWTSTAASTSLTPSC